MLEIAYIQVIGDRVCIHVRRAGLVYPPPWLIVGPGLRKTHIPKQRCEYVLVASFSRDNPPDNIRIVQRITVLSSKPGNKTRSMSMNDPFIN